MRDRLQNPSQRRRRSAIKAAIRYYPALFGTTKAWHSMAAVRRAIAGDRSAMDEMQRASECAVKKVYGYVPAGASWSAQNALMAGGQSPVLGIIECFLSGEAPDGIERRIRERVEKDVRERAEKERKEQERN
jgi:hypothetical protein